jgi:hypothetical protein
MGETGIFRYVEPSGPAFPPAGSVGVTVMRPGRGAGPGRRRTRPSLCGLRLLCQRSGTAERLMAIADNQVISNADHGRYLPPSWRTLYELTLRTDP